MMEREMKDSGIPWIGEIPKDWEINLIGNLYSLRNEKVSDKEYKPLSVTKHGIVPQLETAAKTNDNDNRKLVRIGDFAINSRSDRRGSCGISKYDGSVSLINTIISPRDTMNPQFYNWLFHTELFADEFYRWGHGIVDDLWTTGWQEMKRISIVVPSLNEQKTIAEFLDKKCGDIDELVALQDKMIEELKAYKQSIITETVTKGLNPNVPLKDSGIEWIGEIPQHWNVFKMNQLCSVITDYVASGSFADLKSNVQYLDSPDFAMLVRTADLSQKNSNIKRVYVSKQSYDFLNNSNLFGGEVVLPNIGASIGDVYIVPTNLYENMTLAPNSIMIKSKYSNLYLYYYFLSSIGRESILQLGDSTAQGKFNKTDLRALRVPIPPLAEQQEIADFLDKKSSEIDSLIDLKLQKIEKLKDYKKSIIYEYVTGKKSVM